MEDMMHVNQEQGIPINRLCEALAVSRATLYRHEKNGMSRDKENKFDPVSPKNKLSHQERESILDLLHSERFVDRTPYDIFYTLLDEGRHICSIRSLYRLLEEQNENIDRRPQRSHRNAIKPELMATAPNQVWSWDITKLLTHHRLTYYHLYVMLDMYSRYVVGWLIADREDKVLARRLIQQSTLKQSIQPDQLTIHSDNGPSMTSGTVGDLLEHLGIIKSHSRPYTSNDNPFSESQFKTMKYCPDFPKRFESLAAAERFCQQFFTWYNQSHYHSGLQWLTPETVHYRKDEIVLKRRHEVMLAAYHANPGRFNNKPPKLKSLPEAVYINAPDDILTSKNSLQMEGSMVE